MNSSSPMDASKRREDSKRRLSYDRSSYTAGLEVPFLDPVPEDLQCGICLGVSIEPIVTEECGHLFCRECILTALERKKECPIDRLPLTVNDLRKDVRTQRKILALNVACFYKRHGCSWRGVYSDLEKHADRCDFATVRCPFAVYGCEEVVTRKTLQEHIALKMSTHLLLLCSAVGKLQEENMCITQELELLHREDDRFVWIIPNFETKKGPVYSRKFLAKGLMWYLGVDFEGPDQHAGVYLFAEGHNKRVDFKLYLYSSDATKDKVHVVNDWAQDYKGKGWGPLKFVDRANLAGTGFIVNGCVRIGAEIDGEPFE